MLTESKAREFANQWILGWNAHDLEAVMTHYAEEVVLTSPTAAQLLGDSLGMVKGKKAVRSYFERGLAAYPHLRFELLEVLRGVSSVVVYYVNQKGTKTAEFMEFDGSWKVIRVVANYT